MRAVICSMGGALRCLRMGLLTWVCAAMALALPGCGGSGNDTGPPPTPPAVAAPTITAPPLAQSVVSGQSAVFEVAASGAALEYQWRRDDIDIAGAVAARYTLAAPQASDHGATFSVAVRNAGGSVISVAARLSVLAITTAPVPFQVAAGEAASFAVAFTGDGVSVQWQRNGSDLAGATEATLTLPATTLSDDQSAYAVTLRNAAGSLKSATVRLGVKPQPPGSLELVAGDAGGAGNLDGAADAARFSFITHLALGTSGRLWVVDSEYRVLRRLGSDSQVLTVAGVPGSQQAVDGPAAQARFAGITKIAWSAGPPAAALYLIDGGRLRRVDDDGRVTTLGSAVAGYVDGPLADARFRQLGVVAAHPDGSLLVTEVQDCAVRRIDLAAGVVTTLARSGLCTNLWTTPPTLSGISALAVDGQGRVNALQSGAVLRIDAAGNVTRAAAFDPPSDYWSTGRDLAVDASGRVHFLVANDSQSTGTFFSLRDDGSVSPGFTYATTISTLSPFVITPAGRFVYADTPLLSLRTAGGGGTAGEVLAGAPVIAAKVAAKPLAVQADGKLLRFVKPWGNYGALVRSLPSGAEEVVPLQQDYAGAPSEMVSDGQGGIYTLWTMPGFCITGYCQPEPGRIDRITATGQVQFIAGSGAAGESDGSGNTATFLSPRGLVLDSDGDLFVTTPGRIRRITTLGVVSTLATGVFGSGVLASDREGNLFHATRQGTVIHRITPQGQVSVFHDPAIASADEALRLGIWGLAVAAHGEVLVARCRAAVVDRITPGGAVSTVVGTPGLVGIRTGSLPGALSCPSDLNLDERGNLYIKTDNALLKARFSP